jgi:hypothetical protein
MLGSSVSKLVDDLASQRVDQKVWQMVVWMAVLKAVKLVAWMDVH